LLDDLESDSKYPTFCDDVC